MQQQRKQQEFRVNVDHDVCQLYPIVVDYAADPT